MWGYSQIDILPSNIFKIMAVIIMVVENNSWVSSSARKVSTVQG